MEDSKFEDLYPIVIRLTAIILVTLAFCFVLRKALLLAFYLVVPIVLAVVIAVLYVNDGLSSAERFDTALEDLASACREFFYGLYGVWVGIKSALTDT